MNVSASSMVVLSVTDDMKVSKVSIEERSLPPLCVRAPCAVTVSLVWGTQWPPAVFQARTRVEANEPVSTSFTTFLRVRGCGFAVLDNRTRCPHARSDARKEHVRTICVGQESLVD